MMARIIAIFLFFLFFCMPVQAAEIVHNYHTRIEVQKNGDIKVTETIQVTAEGEKIKRGIYRDLPQYRRTFLGGVLPMEYEILSVRRNGLREGYHTETAGNGDLRIYFGRSDYFLPTGRRYIYELTYTAASQVFPYDDFDELNWNAIGSGWDFPIIKGRAEIVTAENIPVRSFAAYTGPPLSKGTDYKAVQTGTSVLVETTKTLDPGEGLTVAVSWPKGYIDTGYGGAGLAFFRRQHPGLGILLFGLIVMAGYYRYAWDKVGRDPGSRGLAPFYTPPKGISPAMTAYIQTMGDATAQKCMSAAIISLAAKGYLEIEELGQGQYGIARTNKKQSRRPVSEDEQIIYDAIGQEVVLTSENKTMITASAKHQQKLSELCHKRYFFMNSWWWLGGIVPVILSFAAMALTVRLPPEFWIGALFLLVFGGVSLGVFIYAIYRLFTAPAGRKIGSFFLILWAFGFSIGGFMGLFLAGSVASWLVIGAMMLMVAFFIIMRPIMKAPTKEGRELMDHINGLQYYMEAVEEKILQKFDPPEMSRQLYEEYLPYAVALNVESKWADKFAHAMGGALTSQQSVDASPHWYRSSSGSFYSSGGFSVSSMVGSFTSSLGVASTSSSSSSGGGSSGGGGGGGGGGGW